MDAIRCTTRAEADGFASRTDAALGIPRCDRLAGRTTQIGGGIHVTCRCTDPIAPRADCKLATRTKAEPYALTGGGHAYPVIDAETRNALTAAERTRIEDVPESERA